MDMIVMSYEAKHNLAKRMAHVIRNFKNIAYSGDMLSVDGDADAAVEARIRIGWNKFRQLVPLLTNKDVSLIMSCLLYTSPSPRD